jgi:hypothetical protein
VPSATTAIEVSSQLVSIPRIRAINSRSNRAREIFRSEV